MYQTQIFSKRKARAITECLILRSGEIIHINGVYLHEIMQVIA